MAKAELIALVLRLYAVALAMEDSDLRAELGEIGQRLRQLAEEQEA